ncbi:MAG: ATP-binding protein, partial [Polyangiaceae bacterium]
AITFALAALSRKNGAVPSKEHALMDRQVRHLARLVDELLDVARVTHGKVAVERRQLDLAEVAQAAFDAFEAKARANSLSFRIELCERPLFVLGDPQRLEQVIGNLLANAIKYTKPGGTVTLQVGERSNGAGEFALIAVEDNGVGLAPEMRERIFAPFAQVDSTLDRSQGGLGLGLALVQSIVALHGGNARALSNGLGLGSRFEISLPRADSTERSAPRAAASPAHNALLRIVLVEDNPDIRDLLTELLQCSGHSVTPTQDGPSGLEALLSIQPDLAFVDVGLPGFDGYELARRARASGSHARLVALSGYGQKEDKRRSREAGFDEHLVKPVDNDEIVKAVARASA